MSNNLVRTVNNMAKLLRCIIILKLLMISLALDTNIEVPDLMNVTEDEIMNETYLIDKDESLLKCDLFELEPDEYVFFPNGTAYVEAYNQSYNESFYLMVDDFLRVCPPSLTDLSEDRLTSTPFTYISMIGVVVSMISLLLHLMAFVFVPEFHNLPGYNLASLCVSLFLSHLFLLIGQSQQGTGHIFTCQISGILTHFFFLASFLWMLIMAYDVFRSILLATGSLRISSTEFKLKKFLVYSVFSWMVAGIFAATAATVDNLENVPDPYRPKFYEACWFNGKSALMVFFAIPVAAITSLNFLMFGLCAYCIFSNRMKNKQENQKSHLKKNYLLYFRLSVIMGVTWMTGILAPIFHVLWLWYLFAALNALQGLFIFLAFTCTAKVRKYIRSKLCSQRRPSEPNLSPTFQSYCYYANSIENDLNKVVESKDKTVVTDHIVIHL